MKKTVIAVLILILCVALLNGCSDATANMNAWLDKRMAGESPESAILDDIRRRYVKDGSCDEVLIQVLQERNITADNAAERLLYTRALVEIDYQLRYSRDDRHLQSPCCYEYSNSSEAAMDAILNAEWSSGGWFDEKGEFIAHHMLYAAVNSDATRARRVADALQKDASLTENQRMTIRNSFDEYRESENRGVVWELLPDMLSGAWPNPEEWSDATDYIIARMLPDTVEWLINEKQFVTESKEETAKGVFTNHNNVDFPGLLKAMQDVAIPQAERFGAYRDTYLTKGVFAAAREYAKLDDERTLEDTLAYVRFFAQNQQKASIDAMEKQVPLSLLPALGKNEPTGRVIGGTVLVMDVSSADNDFLTLNEYATTMLPADRIPTRAKDAALLIVLSTTHSEFGYYNNAAKAYDSVVHATAYDGQTGELLAQLAPVRFLTPEKIPSNLKTVEARIDDSEVWLVLSQYLGLAK